MGTAKVAISLNSVTLQQLDRLVRQGIFPNRSKAIQFAVEEKLQRLERFRLAQECSKLNPEFEQAVAEEGFSLEVSEWPEY